MSQIVNILGERVSMEQTSFDPSEKFLVSFDEKYKFPGITGPQETSLKALVKKLFSGSGFFEKKQILPPCSPEEKELLLQSLVHRFASLRNELIAERQSQTDSLRLRQLVDHLQRLKEYVDFAKKSDACEEVDEGILAESIGDLSDDQVLQLLRQFVFFILQGQHPLEDFKGRDPNPKGFVARLTKNPMTDFEHFLDEYRHTKQTVPLPIERVIEATKLNVQAMQDEVENSFNDKIQTVLDTIHTVLPADNPFWSNLDTKNLDAIVDRLLETIQELQSDVEDCSKEALKDQSTIVELDTKKKQLEQELQLLQGKLQIVEANSRYIDESSNDFVEFNSQLEKVKNGLEEQIAKMQKEIDNLITLLEEAEAKANANSAEIKEKNTTIQKIQELEQTNRDLIARLADHQEKLSTAKERIQECEELDTRVKVLEKTLQTRESELANLRSQAGPLTQEIDTHLREKAELDTQIEKAREEAAELKSLLSNISTFLDSLTQEKSIVLNLLGEIQRRRAEIVPENDAVLQKLRGLQEKLSQTQTNTTPSTLSQETASILQDVQEEVATKEKEIASLEKQIQEKDALVAAAKQKMEESDVLLNQIRNGRIASGDTTTETDREFLEKAIRSVEAEKELKKAKEELDAALQESNGKKSALEQEVVALEAKHTKEIETIQGQYNLRTQELQAEKALRIQNQAEISTLQQSLQTKDQEVQRALEQLEQERDDSMQKISRLQETSLRECEERIVKLRAEEEEKRQMLVGLQGAEKGTLEGKIQELVKQITAIEGQRDTVEAELTVEKEQLETVKHTLEQVRAEKETAVHEVEERLKTAEEEKKELVGTSASLQEEVKELREQVIADGTEKAKLFSIISKISEWISTGASIEEPIIDEQLNRKYGIHRIVDSFLSSLPQETVESEPESEQITARARCYLVFFMTYVYARHFPSKPDGDSSYQSQLTAFLKGILTELYKQLEVGIPGKLEPVGSSGIPLQLKSKYVMTILMTLIQQMELVHQSGKKGADFLKFSLLDKDQLRTIHTLHSIILEKLKLAPKDTLETLQKYAIRKSGNTDEDIGSIYLRFFHETKSDKEYPVIVYQPATAKEVPKLTFGSEIDFTQYLSSPLQKAGTPVEKQITVKPIFSFNLMFYLFLFVVKDYLSSIEGELDKSGCPLPMILKHH